MKKTREDDKVGRGLLGGPVFQEKKNKQQKL